MSIAPVVHTLTVRTNPVRSFELFTSRMGDWWAGKTVGPNPHVAIIVEPKVGGRWFERDAGGAETEWGKVLAWEPPSRLLLGWQLDSSFRYDPEMLTEVELSFKPLADGGTRVRLEHRDLERYGADADRIAHAVDEGWPKVIAGFQRLTDTQEENGNG